ncbi:transcriptional repressor [Microvirga sp. HBU67558]|uniref:Fur family transcriptional regulator n=1 Tax=Microvirga TaxID=186650 RepID=UPI001B3779DF|nr:MULTISPECIES: transcriptional repressor [unclassified Microvirga]MBQ0824893.1 transcriptional repressor [Microvirga sp. HBU67558]
MAHALSLHHRLSHADAPIGSERTARAIAQSEAVCRSKGARLTPIRRRVLEALHGVDGPLGAYDLVDLLGSQGRRMAPITIYRALDFLIEQDLVHRLASRNAYIASSGTVAGTRTTAFLICEGCGDVNEIASPDVAETVLKVLREQGYQPRTKVLEITGRCTRCQDVH